MNNKKSYEIDLWELPSMNDKIYKILQNNGIREVSALAIANFPNLVGLNIPGTIASRLIKESEVLMEKFGPKFVMGEALLKEFEELETLTSGCSQLDAILDGGFITKRLYEFYGPEQVGKTNMLHQILCCAMLPKEKGGFNCPVIYLDAEGNFAQKRIYGIAPRLGLTPKYVLDRIAKIEIPSSNYLLEILDQRIPEMMEKTKARLLLLDSVTTNVREEYVGLKNLPMRQGMLSKIAHSLKKLNKAFNAISIISNQITGIPDKDGIIRSYGHAGGNILGHEVQVRLEMRFVEDDIHMREIFLEKAVDIPQASCLLRIDGEGFHDLENEDTNQDIDD